jgi:NAD(P)H-dependent flavin oxidoreductase YrpB (nitropropane dioxygenase family)
VSDDELFAVDPEIVEREARAIAARIVADDQPETEYRRVLRESGSPAYAQVVAERAAAIVVAHVFTENEVAVSVVPAFTRRLAGFIDKARMQLALFEFGRDQRGQE